MCVCVGMTRFRGGSAPGEVKNKFQQVRLEESCGDEVPAAGGVHVGGASAVQSIRLVDTQLWQGDMSVGKGSYHT